MIDNMFYNTMFQEVIIAFLGNSKKSNLVMQQHPYIFGKSKMDLQHDLTYIIYGYLWTYSKYFMKFDLGYALLGQIFLQ